MQQHIYYTKYALQFADMQIPELVNIFNSQVQMIRHSSTSSNTAASTLQPLVMAKPPLSHILSDMTYPTTS